MRWLAIIVVFCASVTAAHAQGGMGPGPGTVHTTGGGGTVTVDATTSSITTQASGTSITISNMTVGSGSGRGLLLLMQFGSNKPASITCNWDNAGTPQAMTPIAATDTGNNAGVGGDSLFYGLLAPTAGNKSAVCTWTGTVEAHVSMISFTGVNQGSIAAAFPNGTTVNLLTPVSTTISIPITSATGHKVVSAFGQNCAAWGAVSGTTIAVDDTTGPNLAVVSSYNSGASTVTQTAVAGSLCSQIASGVDVSP